MLILLLLLSFHTGIVQTPATEIQLHSNTGQIQQTITPEGLKVNGESYNLR